MGVYEEVRGFERTGEDVVSQAIEDALDDLRSAATARWAGRMIEFKHSWHFSEDPTVYRAPIDDVLVFQGSGGVVRVEFGVTLRNPRSGFEVPLNILPDLCEFVDAGSVAH